MELAEIAYIVYMGSPCINPSDSFNSICSVLPAPHLTRALLGDDLQNNNNKRQEEAGRRHFRGIGREAEPYLNIKRYLKP